MSKQEFIKTQTCVLRVNIHCDCDGCRNKVKKLLLKVDGVYTVSIDAKQGKVTVAGNVDPAVLIQKLEKSGKHAELWGGQKGNNQFNLTTQFKNLQMDSGKGGHNKGNNNNSSSNNKTQKGGGGGGKDHQHQHQQHQKGGHGQQMFQPQMQQHHNQSQQMKGSKDQKSVKFNVPQHANHNNHHHFDEDFDEGDDYDDDDEYDEEDEDGYDDEFDEDEENEFDDVFGQSNHSHAKNNIHVMGNNAQKHKASGKTGKDKKSGDPTKAKKSSGGFSLPAIFKSIAGNGNADNKKSNGSKKGNNGHGNNNAKGGNHNKGGNGGGGATAKHGGKGGAEAKNGGKNGGGGGNNKNGGANNGHNNGKKGGGGGGSKAEGFHEMSVPHHNGKGNGNLGPMGQMGNYPMGHNNIPAAAHGLPAVGMMNGVGYYNQGMMGGGPPAAAAYGNPYANQQYMAMMMNQQRMNGEGMHPQIMYGPPPAYMTPMPPPPVYDPVTHIFSDENTGSCSIM